MMRSRPAFRAFDDLPRPSLSRQGTALFPVICCSPFGGALLLYPLAATHG